jgi:hypothetical protein
MKRILAITILTLAISSLVPSQTKPNFSGTWKLRVTEISEVYTFEHQEPKLRVIMNIEDNLGKRTLDVKGVIDGKEHKQTLNGSPATFIAKWEGEALTWELRRESPVGVLHNRRTMTLSKDGKVITADRIRLLPEPEERWTETWDKQ